MAGVTAAMPDYTEPLEEQANRGTEDGVPVELLDELPEQFREAASEDLGDAMDSLAAEEAAFSPDAEPEPEMSEEELLGEAEPEPEQPKSRAQERIRKLANERKELQTKLEQIQTQAQQQAYYLQQQAQLAQEQERQRYEAQMQQMQRQLELIQTKAEREEEKNLSPMEQYERKILRQAEERAQTVFRPQLEQMQQALVAQQKAAEAARAEAERRARWSYYDQQADAVTNALTDGMEVDEGLKRELKDQVLTYGAAFGMEPGQAQARFQQFLTRYAQAVLKKNTQNRGTRVAQNKRLPTSAPPARAPTAQTAMPSLDQLRANGYDNHIEWMARGEPALRPVK